MGSPRTHLLLLACALAAATATVAHAGTLRVAFVKSPNRTDSNRGLQSIDRIVIHVTEGRFWGSVRWLANRRSGGSAHYVVSRDGHVVQLVSTTDVAWHSGNRWVNRHSVGIEHEGWSFGRRSGFSTKQYESSARLVAYLAVKARLPIDRRHIIGHDEVPDPNHRGRFGGADHHLDPGPFWNWKRYLALVRRYAKEPAKPLYVRGLPNVVEATPPAPRTVVSRGPAAVRRGATLRGLAPWWSGIDASRRWRRGIWKVDFLVDGRTLWSDSRWPFAFRGGRGFDSRSVANGRHMLSIRVYGRHGYRARKQLPVRVANPPMTLALDGVAAGSVVRGALRVRVRPSERVERVSLTVDGRPVSRDGSAGYTLSWDSTLVPEGSHELLVHAQARSGRRATVRLPVLVVNAPDAPESFVDPFHWAEIG